jgi:enoyl-CoA hydratase/carnithine racemase
METISLERDAGLPGLATLTLNRPDKLNAINARMHAEIQQACLDLRDDAATRVLILTGSGRAFSAGADLGRRSASPAQGPPAVGVDGDDALQERLRASAGNRTSAALESLPPRLPRPPPLRGIRLVLHP